MGYAKISGYGLYAPGAPIDNYELKSLTGTEFDAEKLESKIGIRSRHVARLRGLDESTADFCHKAAVNALEWAGVAADDIDLFVVGTDTPEYVSPATAVLVQGRLQGKERFVRAFDVNASCASFSVALDTAARVVATDSSVRRALVIGVYNMPAHVRQGDAFGYSIFADGAGAVILERVEDDSAAGYVDGCFLSDGTQWDYVGVYAGGTRRPVTREVLDSGKYGLELLQRLPGDRNVRLWPMAIAAFLQKAGLTCSQVDHFLFTQINRSVIEQVMHNLDRPMNATTCIMDRYGYTGSGCIPMALWHAVHEGRINKGELVLAVTSGAGLSVGVNAFRI